MSKQFEKWVEESIRQHCQRPGMLTGAQHPLGHYEAKRAARLAWDHQQEKIDDLVGALRRYYSAPEGWKLVPIEPTEEMLDAVGEVMDCPASIYYCMIDAAPKPEETTDD